MNLRMDRRRFLQSSAVSVVFAGGLQYRLDSASESGERSKMRMERCE